LRAVRPKTSSVPRSPWLKAAGSVEKISKMPISLSSCKSGSTTNDRTPNCRETSASALGSPIASSHRWIAGSARRRPTGRIRVQEASQLWSVPSTGSAAHHLFAAGQRNRSPSRSGVQAGVFHNFILARSPAPNSPTVLLESCRPHVPANFAVNSANRFLARRGVFYPGHSRGSGTASITVRAEPHQVDQGLRNQAAHGMISHTKAHNG